RIPAHRDRHLDLVAAPGAGVRAAQAGSRATAGAADGQWPGVPGRSLRPVGQGQRHGDPVHPAGQAQPERLHRTLQPDLARRGPGPASVRHARRRPRSHVAMDDPVQRGKTPRLARRSDAGRVPSTSRRKLYFYCVCLTGELTLWPLLYLALARIGLLGAFGSTHALVDDWYNHTQYFALFMLGYLV